MRSAKGTASAAHQAGNTGGHEVPVLRGFRKSAKGTASAAHQAGNTGGHEVPVLRGFRKSAKGTASAAHQAGNTGGYEVPVLRGFRKTFARLRVHEWMFIAFFVYIAAITPLFQTRPNLHGQPYVVLGAVCLVFLLVSRLQQTRLSFGMDIARDWLPLFFLFFAFREMDYFAPREYDFLTEMSWIRWDLVVLEGFKVTQRIESLGPIIPFYLELCYLVVYAVGAYCVARLSALAGRKAINRFWTIFLLGTLVSYALFPYFPTEPPRFAFTDIAPPSVPTIVREWNWYVLSRSTIHSGVFPSAHVSAAFSAAFALLLLMPKRRDGLLLTIYAISVAIATVYGRYHYVVDALAGFGVSLLAAALCLLYYAKDVKRSAPQP